MRYSFTCYGHENVTAKHKTTLEFTKDEELSLEGDCIVGVKADFSFDSLKKFINKTPNQHKKITITIKTIKKDENNNNKIKNKDKIKKLIEEKITAEINPEFNSDNEIVIRKTNFLSERTFAIKADKSSSELNRNLIDFLKDKTNKVMVVLEF